MASSNESLALSRERRSNAGAKMTRLLEAEDDDDFYKTTYGGFNEEVDDNDYESEASASDVTDSDIDINEDDELKDEVGDDAETKRKKRITTNAYKEPKKRREEESQPAPKQRPEKREKQKHENCRSIDTDKKSLRKSTAEKSRSTEDCVREREAKAEILRQIAEKKKVAEVRRLTQEELLAEAKITEEINIRSLETYQKLELEKKKARIHRQTHSGSLIRYHSLTFPLIEEIEAEINVDVEAADSKSRAASKSIENCSRNFITFTDERLFHKYFPRKRPQPTERYTCPITGLPAKYYDPVTRSPYATLQAFKLLREAYDERLKSLPTEKEATEGKK